MSKKPAPPRIWQIRPFKWLAEFSSASGKESVQALVVGKNPEPLAKKLAHAEAMHTQLQRIRDAATGFLADSEVRECTDTGIVLRLLGEFRDEIDQLLTELDA